LWLQEGGMIAVGSEKIPDAPRREVAYAGIAVSSRYGKRRELETMMAALDYVADRAPSLLGLIVEIFCDSKACAVYTVRCCRANAPCSPEEIYAVSDMLDHAFREVGGGHNGITVEPNDDDLRVDVSPWWSGDRS
jgi:hypothetical protein